MAIFQNDRHLQRSSWLGAISQGGWLCCARRLSRYWQSRLLAWLRQQRCWLVEAVGGAEGAAVATAAVAGWGGAGGGSPGGAEAEGGFRGGAAAGDGPLLGLAGAFSM